MTGGTAGSSIVYNATFTHSYLLCHSHQYLCECRELLANHRILTRVTFWLKPLDNCRVFIKTCVLKKKLSHKTYKTVNINSSDVLKFFILSSTEAEMHRALYPFRADDRTQLSLQPGSEIEVVEKLDTGWWRGYIGTQNGWFPATYVEPIQPGNINLSGYIW